MPDHINDEIPLEQLLIYMDGELIFDGSDPDTYVVLEPGANLADLLARDRLSKEILPNPTALCICGHTAAEHADPTIGDTRCLVVGDRDQLECVFDDGRDTVHAYCACLRFTPAMGENPPQRA